LTNGGFEAALTGWKATGNLAVVTGSFWRTTEGSHAVAFNAGQSLPNGVLSQSFPTTPGQIYTLTFDSGALSDLNQYEQRLAVSVRGRSIMPLLSQLISQFAPGNGTRYDSHSFSFTADSPSATLTFQDQSAVTMNVDLMLDNIRVASR